LSGEQTDSTLQPTRFHHFFGLLDSVDGRFVDGFVGDFLSEVGAGNFAASGSRFFVGVGEIHILDVHFDSLFGLTLQIKDNLNSPGSQGISKFILWRFQANFKTSLKSSR
jgi:hypothetical protein